jgi:MraZ protein
MFQRLFHQGAKQVVLDSAGRVHIPITHITRVGLKKDVILIAYHDRIEIWDRQRYFEMIDSNMKDFAELADKVMGGIDHEKYE